MRRNCAASSPTSGSSNVPTIPTARVLVAKQDLVVGTFVKREDLHWQQWPEESITPAYVTDSKLLDAGKSDQKRLTVDDFIGGVVRQPIAAGQPLVRGLVAKAGERGFLAAVLQFFGRRIRDQISGEHSLPRRNLGQRRQEFRDGDLFDHLLWPDPTAQGLVHHIALRDVA